MKETTRRRNFGCFFLFVFSFCRKKCFTPRQHKSPLSITCDTTTTTTWPVLMNANPSTLAPRSASAFLPFVIEGTTDRSFLERMAPSEIQVPSSFSLSACRSLEQLFSVTLQPLTTFGNVTSKHDQPCRTKAGFCCHIS